MGRPAFFRNSDVCPHPRFMVLRIEAYDGREGPVSLIRTPRFEENDSILRPAFVHALWARRRRLPLRLKPMLCQVPRGSFERIIALATVGCLHR